MDTFVDSSWYYMRYACPDAPTMVDARNDYWMPMDQYIGGIEHAILHLLYARFWTKVMRDLGLVKIDEPFTRLLTQGMVLNHIYFRRTRQGRHRLLRARRTSTSTHDAEGRVTGARLKADGKPVEYGGIGTMSKSKRNGVDPQDLIDRYGADTARLFVMFAGPPEDSALDGPTPASKARTASCAGCGRSRQTHADAVDAARGARRPHDAAPAVKAARREMHLDAASRRTTTTSASSTTPSSRPGMKMLNALEAMPADARGAQRVAARGPVDPAARALSGRAAHRRWALWDELGFAAEFGDLLDAPWPQVDAAALAQDEIELVLQVNGKLRGKLTVPRRADKAAIEARGARQRPKSRSTPPARR